MGSRISTFDRQIQVLERRRVGMTFEAIGRELGVSRQRAFQLYTDAIAAIVLPAVADARKAEVDRLDAMLAKAYDLFLDEHPLLYKGEIVRGVADARTNIASGQLLIRIAERRAKLLGLDAPVRVDVTITDEALEAEIRLLEAEAADEPKPTGAQEPE